MRQPALIQCSVCIALFGVLMAARAATSEPWLRVVLAASGGAALGLALFVARRDRRRDGSKR